MRASVCVDSLEIESNPYHKTHLSSFRSIENRDELFYLTHEAKSARV